jgi:hypothetical protein
MRPILLSVCSLSLLLTGCDEIWADRGDRFTENFSYSYSLKPGGRLSVENMNGAVEISGWDRDTVEITGTKYAATEQLLRSMRIDVQQSADAIRVRTIPPSGTRGNMGARYTIRVPRRVELERIASSNGHVETRDLGYAHPMEASAPAIPKVCSRSRRPMDPLMSTTISAALLPIPQTPESMWTSPIRSRTGRFASKVRMVGSL